MHKNIVKLYGKGKALTDENNFKKITCETLNEALETAEYFWHEHGYGARIIDSDGEIYAEYEL